MTRNVVVSIIIILFTAGVVYSQEALRIEKTVTLAEIAYPTDVLLQGYNPEQDFFFEISGDRLDPENSYLRLAFRLSEVLGPNTVLNIRMNGIPAKSVFLRDVGYEPVLHIPVDMLSHETLFPRRSVLREEYIRVSVAAEYDIRDITPGISASSALWMIIKNSSYIHMTSYRDIDDPAIMDFLGQIVGDVHVVTPVEPSGAILQSVVWVVSDLKRRTMYTPRSVGYSVGMPQGPENNIYDYIVISGMNQITSLPEAFTLSVDDYFSPDDVNGDQGIIILHTDGNRRILFLTGKTESGVLNAVRGFLSETSRNSMIGRTATVLETGHSIGTEWPAPPYPVTFERLGYRDISLDGRGGVRRSLHFKKQALGVAPGNLVLYLSGRHTEIPRGDNVYLTVYFNDIVAGSWRLNRDGTFENKSVRLQNYILENQNSIHFEFVYIPARGREIPEFLLTIDKNSFIEVRRSRPARRPDFAVAMEAFHTSAALVLSGNDEKSILNAAALISAIDRHYDTKYLYPSVYMSDEISRAIFDTTNVIAVLDGNDQLFEKIDDFVLLNPQYEMKVRNVQTREIMFELTPDRQFAIMQVMRPHRSTFTLIATATGNTGGHLAGEFIGHFMERPQMLEGDIALYGGDGNVHIFNTSAGFAELDYPHRKTFISTVQENRFVIFLVLWIIFIVFVVMLALYARKRSYKSVEIKTP